MIGLSTVASLEGFIIGVLCGLVPLAAGYVYKQWLPALLGLLACAVSGFACGLLGGIPMIVLTYAVVISYAYVNKQDPFTSRAALEEVSFEETATEAFQRTMANLGNTLRAALRALVRNPAGFIGFLGILFFVVMTSFGPLFIEYEGKAQMSRRQPGASSLLAGPSAEHPLGLDWQGRDVL
jgi:hypothetical protein